MELKKAEYKNAIPINNEWEYFNKDYLAHYRGYVRSLITGKLLKAGKSKAGYLTVSLRGSTKTIHRLVAETFIPNPLNLPCVNHKDGNKLNNHVSNLEWVSYGENNSHAIRIGLKKSINQAKGVIQLDMNGNEVARFHSSEHAVGFSSGNICHVCNGKRKSHGGFKWKYINN